MPVLACPKCSTPLNIAESMAGMVVACPKCGQQLQIPAAGPAPAQGVQARPPQPSPPQAPRQPATPAPPPQAIASGPPPPARPAPVAAGPPKAVGGPGVQAGGAETVALSGGFLTSMSKPILFGLLGALGCFLGAVFIALPHWLVLRAAEGDDQPPPPKVEVTSPKADIMFVLDVTGSMQPQINGVRAGVGRFLDKLRQPVLVVRRGATAAEIEQVAKRVEAMGHSAQVKQGERSATISVSGGEPNLKALQEIPDVEKVFRLDVRVGLTYFRDRFVQGDGPAEDPVAIELPRGSGKHFTTDAAEFRLGMAELNAERGGDVPESTYDALVYAAGGQLRSVKDERPLPAVADYRKDAVKILVLITDAPPKEGGDKEMQTLAQCKTELQRQGVQQLHVIASPTQGAWRPLEIYRPLRDQPDKEGKVPANAITGMEFDLNQIAAGGSFDDALPRIGTSVVEETAERAPGIGALGSARVFRREAGGVVLIAAILLGAFLGLGLALLLIAGQRLYLRQSWFSPGVVAKASLGLAAGAVGGLVGGGLLAAGAGGAIAVILQILGWTLLGSLVGLGMALFVPNLIWHRGLLGGTIGGFAGGIGFVLMERAAGEFIGRWIGALILGFCIGIMVALAEVAFRRWWLEVRFGPREVRTVTLGSSVISVGSDERMATLVVRDVPSLVLRYALQEQKVLCQDVASGQTSELKAGDSRKVGNVTITVCSPETVKQVGLELKLSSGRSVPLSEGLPLTAEELPGLMSNSPDGTVAILSRKPTDPQVLLLHNRSKQAWSMVEANGAQKVVEPGRGLTLEEGVRINFGQVYGELVRARG